MTRRPPRAVWLALAVALAWAMPAGLARADFPSAVKDWDAGRRDAALTEWLRLAEAGDPTSAFNVAVLYRNGDGVPADPVKFRHWLERAAAGGFAPALEMLGTMTMNGDGVAVDFDAAFAMLSRAAEAGLAGARNNLAVLYMMGKGHATDLVEAFAWATLAARAGNAQAPAVLEMLRPKMTRQQLGRAKVLADLRASGQAPAAAVKPAPPPSAAVKPALAPPAAVKPAPAKLAAQPPPPAPAPAAPPTPSAGGAFSAHLVSAVSQGGAESEWKRLQRRYPALAGRQPEYQAVDLGAKGLMVRLFVGGFADRAAAAAFCAEIKGADCLVTADKKYR